MKRFFRRFLLLFSAGVLIICGLSSIFAMKTQSDIASKVIRIHVIANSDSDADQALKLDVRDGILESAESLTDGCTDREEALRILSENSELLEERAASVIADMGYSYDCELSLSEEYYPTREYDGLRLPAGRYLSLKLTIGRGEGKNFWCILFPPVCRSTARADEELEEVGFTPNQIRLLSDDEDVRYVIKFKTVELCSEICEKIGNIFGRRRQK